MKTPQTVLRSGKVVCPWCEYERLQGLSMQIRGQPGVPRKHVMIGLGCRRCGLVIPITPKQLVKSDMTAALQRRVSRARRALADIVPGAGSPGSILWEAGDLQVRWKTLGLPDGLTWAFHPGVCVEREKPDRPRRRPARGGTKPLAEPKPADTATGSGTHDQVLNSIPVL